MKKSNLGNYKKKDTKEEREERKKQKERPEEQKVRKGQTLKIKRICNIKT